MKLLIALILLLPLSANCQEEPLSPSDKRSNDEYHRLDMEDRAERDARMYYEGYGPAKNGTFFTTLVAGGVIGLIPAIACSSTPPAYHHLNFPDSALMQDNFYREAYLQKAKKIKQRKVWGGYGTGVVTAIVLSAIVLFVAR